MGRRRRTRRRRRRGRRSSRRNAAGRRGRWNDQPPSTVPIASSTPSVGAPPEGISTWARSSCVRPRTLIAFSSGTDWVDGKYVAAIRSRNGRRGAINAATGRLSSGRTWWRRASSHHRSIIAASRSGSSAARSLRLGRIDPDVVELPLVVLEGRVRVQAVVVHRTEGLERHRLPSLVVDPAGAEHLEVLGGVPLRRHPRRRGGRRSSSPRSATARPPRARWARRRR